MTNPGNESGTADEMLVDADVFIGVSVPGAVTRAGIARMAQDSIVFALANPRSEIDPEEIEDLAAVIATGRSDYPNQINNVLVFPGVFRGALDVRASAITREMELAAAHALAGAIPHGSALTRLHHPQRLRPDRRASGGACGRRSGAGRGSRTHRCRHRRRSPPATHRSRTASPTPASDLAATNSVTPVSRL